MVERLILLKNRMPIDGEDFFSRLFPRSFESACIANKIFRLMLEGKLTKESYKTVTKELEIPQAKYYKILNKFKELGLIKTIDHRFVVSRDFSKNLHRLAEYYESLISSASKHRE